MHLCPILFPQARSPYGHCPGWAAEGQLFGAGHPRDRDTDEGEHWEHAG